MRVSVFKAAAESAYSRIKAPRKRGTTVPGCPSAWTGRASAGALRLRDGEDCHPATSDPGKPSRPPLGPPALVTMLPGAYVVAAPASARSPEGWGDGDGMAEIEQADG